jgi:hypothetical protein
VVITGGVNNLIPDPHFVHGYLQFPANGIHRVTGVESPVTSWGIEEQIRAGAYYDVFGSGGQTDDGQIATSNVAPDWGDNTTEGDHDAGGFPLSGVVVARDRFVTANLHWLVAEAAPSVDGGAATPDSAVLKDGNLGDDYNSAVGATYIAHPDSYIHTPDGAQGTIRFGPNTNKFFMSIWIPPNATVNGSGSGMYYNWDTLHDGDHVGSETPRGDDSSPHREFHAHAKVMFGLKGDPFPFTANADGQYENQMSGFWDLMAVGGGDPTSSGSGTKDMSKQRYSYGPTSNVISKFDDPNKKAIICSNDDVFSFRIWVRKHYFQEHNGIGGDTSKPYNSPLSADEGDIFLLGSKFVFKGNLWEYWG